MKLSDVWKIIEDSSALDWSFHKTKNAPTYKNNWHPVDDLGRNFLPSEPNYLASYDLDLSISMAWGMTSEVRENRDIPGAWHFINPHAGMYLIDVFYNNTLVIRQENVHLDEYRVHLPAPSRYEFKGTWAKSSKPEYDGRPEYDYFVTERSIRLTELSLDIESREDFCNIRNDIEQAQFIIEK